MNEIIKEMKVNTGNNSSRICFRLKICSVHGHEWLTFTRCECKTLKTALKKAGFDA